jgi:nucleoid-associated protein YgaU
MNRPNELEQLDSTFDELKDETGRSLGGDAVSRKANDLLIRYQELKAKAGQKEQQPQQSTPVTETAREETVTQNAGSSSFERDTAVLVDAYAARKVAIDAGAETYCPDELLQLDFTFDNVKNDVGKSPGDDVAFNKATDLPIRYKQLQEKTAQVKAAQQKVQVDETARQAEAKRQAQIEAAVKQAEAAAQRAEAAAKQAEAARTQAEARAQVAETARTQAEARAQAAEAARKQAEDSAKAIQAIEAARQAELQRQAEEEAARQAELQLQAEAEAEAARLAEELARLEAEEAAARAATLRTYTVQQGDSYTQISSEVYDDPALWSLLYEANRDKMRDPNNPHLIYPNMIIDVPNVE